MSKEFEITLVETLRDYINDKVNPEDIVTPQMFGAMGDGETDDTSAVQQAVNKGKIVYFPKGKYVVKNVAISSNTTLVGEYGQSIIQAPSSVSNNDSLIRLGNEDGEIQKNINISNLVFRGSETFGTLKLGLTLIDICNSKYISIKDTVFQNNLYASISSKNGTNIDVDRCKFEACGLGITSVGHIASNDINITNCHFTGISSYNEFVNYNGEQISIHTDLDAGVSYRWRVENCLFEHRQTNAICFSDGQYYSNDGAQANGWTDKNTIPDGTILVKDCIIRNITTRGCAGAINMLYSKDILVDGVYMDKTEKQHSLEKNYRLIYIGKNCDNVTVKNAVLLQSDLSQVIYLDATSKNCTIEDVKIETSVVSSQHILLKGDYQTLKNISVKLLTGSENFMVDVRDLTNSYIDIKKADGSISEKNIIYFCTKNSGETVSNINNNTFIVQTNSTRFNRNSKGQDLLTTVDTNIYEVVDDKAVNLSSLANTSNGNPLVISDKPSKKYIVSLDQTGYDSSIALANFPLLNDGFEFELRFKLAKMAGKTFTFAKGGNIVAIDKPFAFSSSYNIICKFKQVNGKWIEYQRLLDYTNAATKDVTYETESSTSNLDLVAVTGRYNALDIGLNNTGLEDVDNASIFQQFINNAKIPEGSVIYFPHGVYVFKSPVYFNKGFKLVGETIITHRSNVESVLQPQSQIKFCSDEPNQTLFTRNRGALDIQGFSFFAYGSKDSENKRSLTFDVDYSKTPLDTTKSNPIWVETVNQEGINCIDVATGTFDKDGVPVESWGTMATIKNCSFCGFSGVCIEVVDHRIVTNCSFIRCGTGIKAIGTDNMVRDCWWSRCSYAIHVTGEKKYIPKTSTSEGSAPYSNIEVSNCWADQLSNHFIYGTKTKNNYPQVMMMVNDCWVDMVDKAAIYIDGTIHNSRITGRFSRCCMMWAGAHPTQYSSAKAMEFNIICAKSILTSMVDIDVHKRAIGQKDRCINPNGVCPMGVIGSYNGEAVKKSFVRAQGIDYDGLVGRHPYVDPSNPNTTKYLVITYGEDTVFEAYDKKALRSSLTDFEYLPVRNIKRHPIDDKAKPPCVGAYCIDSKNKKIYISTGTTQSDWEEFADLSGSKAVTSGTAMTAITSFPYICEKDGYLTLDSTEEGSYVYCQISVGDVIVANIMSKFDTIQSNSIFVRKGSKITKMSSNGATNIKFSSVE